MIVICAGAGASGIHLAYELKHKFTYCSLDICEENDDMAGTRPALVVYLREYFSLLARALKYYANS